MAPSGITPTRDANVLAAVHSEALRRHDGYHPRSLLDYARQKLFDPLGVDTEPAYTGYEWQAPQTSRFEEAGFGWDRQTGPILRRIRDPASRARHGQLRIQ
jgi:hypothetical protein